MNHVDEKFNLLGVDKKSGIEHFYLVKFTSASILEQLGLKGASAEEILQVLESEDFRATLRFGPRNYAAWGKEAIEAHVITKLWDEDSVTMECRLVDAKGNCKSWDLPTEKDRATLSVRSLVSSNQRVAVTLDVTDHLIAHLKRDKMRVSISWVLSKQNNAGFIRIFDKDVANKPDPVLVLQRPCN
eukprot:TRINITY_DN6115_c0_g1_i2.p1 TRINITY_DN6115_c0_g1~~TRINITY_DN6115_c0_g1_i2.p1  ORF type:complete len:186 (-),score=30.55 TRINITY_DN6115_c0_g1_i2:76-633(-)